METEVVGSMADDGGVMGASGLRESCGEREIRVVDGYSLFSFLFIIRV